MGEVQGRVYLQDLGISGVEGQPLLQDAPAPSDIVPLPLFHGPLLHLHGRSCNTVSSAHWTSNCFSSHPIWVYSKPALALSVHLGILGLLRRSALALKANLSLQQQLIGLCSSECSSSQDTLPVES